LHHLEVDYNINGIPFMDKCYSDAHPNPPTLVPIPYRSEQILRQCVVHGLIWLPPEVQDRSEAEVSGNRHIRPVKYEIAVWQAEDTRHTIRPPSVTIYHRLIRPSSTMLKQLIK